MCFGFQVPSHLVSAAPKSQTVVVVVEERVLEEVVIVMGTNKQANKQTELTD
jgi:hypothetical protein